MPQVKVQYAESTTDKTASAAWVRVGLQRFLLVVVVIVLVGVNGLAWMQARAVTHFVSPGMPLLPIESLSLGQRMQLTALGVPLPRPENHFTPTDAGVAYETHTITLNDSEWLEGWWVPHPQPRGTVVMFSGYAASKQQVGGAAQVLYNLGFNLFLIDFRGAGGSSGSTTTLGIREAEDVAAAVAYARQTWPPQRILLYGTSMGGGERCCGAVAVHGVQPDAIIIESPFDQLLSAVRVPDTRIWDAHRVRRLN
ncbi:MAG: alpha/beta fold hydrolase [Blastochloris sp.]|nr:alpha/beta fold hydrolase [Blastochloris sp.]